MVNECGRVFFCGHAAAKGACVVHSMNGKHKVNFVRVRRRRVSVYPVLMCLGLAALLLAWWWLSGMG